MQDVPARRGSGGALSTTHRAGAEAAAELIARSASAHTRRVYASALGLLAAWLDGRRLDDASLAAYLGYLHQAGRAPATAALAVAAVRRAARDAGEEPPAGPLTRQGLEGFRRSAAADAPARRGQARGLTAEECAAVLATCGRPRRTGRRPRARRDGRARWRRRRHRPPLEDESGRRSSRRPAPGRRLRGRHPPPAGGDRAGTRRFYRRSQRRPGEPPVCGRLRRGRPRGPQNLARGPRGTRRRAHRPRGRHLRRPARRRLEGRQHGGPLRRLGRHPGRRRQPLHAMKKIRRGRPVTTWGARSGRRPGGRRERGRRWPGRNPRGCDGRLSRSGSLSCSLRGVGSMLDWANEGYGSCRE